MSHRVAMEAALEGLDAHPDWLIWHYVHAAVERHGDISKAARALGMHRRTLQRVLHKRCPPIKPVLAGPLPSRRSMGRR